MQLRVEQDPDDREVTKSPGLTLFTLPGLCVTHKYFNPFFLVSEMPFGKYLLSASTEICYC